MTKFLDMHGKPGMDQDCFALCVMKEVCLLDGCRKVNAAKTVKDASSSNFIARATPLINRVLKTKGMAGVMHAIPSRRRQRRAAMKRTKVK